MQRFTLATLTVILVLAGGFFVLSFILPAKEFLIENQQAAIDFSLEFAFKDIPEAPEITLFLVGDIMLNRGVEYMIEKYGEGDFRFPFLKIAEELKKADILFGNLEGPISDKGIKVGSICSFRFRPEAIEGLTFAGFDILSLANNHMLDYQSTALKETMMILKGNGIDYIGAGFNREEAFSVKIKETEGVRVGFLAYTNLGPKTWMAQRESPGLAWIDEKSLEAIQADIENFKQAVDILVVSLHAGTEYSLKPTPFQISFAQASIEAGADLVVGHHPHVVQKIEKYKEGWIAYSLGDFVFDQDFSEETLKSILLKVIIKNGKIEQVIPQDIKINKYFQPEKTEEKPTETLEIKDSETPLNVVNRILAWGHHTPLSPRLIDTIIIHSSYDALGENPYNIDGIIQEYKLYGVLPHYLIARDGTIYRLALDKDIAYHAGVSKMPDGRTNVNNFSIGIELVNSKSDTPTKEQYNSLGSLVKFLKTKYKINYILGHNQIAPDRKTDPWNFDWAKFYEALK